MNNADSIHAFVDAHRDQWLEEVNEFLRIPSVSTDPDRADRVVAAADWLADKLREAGCDEVEKWPTDGHPVIYGAWRKAPGAPTLLVYGHYDVQPEEPVELWDTPPFEPTVRDGKLFARGSADDKGQLYIHVKALQAWLETTGGCPVNVVFLIEGEEEVGSPNIAAAVFEHQDRLECDAVMISDTIMFAAGLPSITYSLRGLAYMQLDLTGARGDLHSGSFGGAVVNPAEALARMLASCRSADTGEITIPGFYDDVVALTDAERAQWSSLPFDEAQYRDDLGVNALLEEAGYDVLERTWARPTFEVNGFLSGFTGEGSKTVLPAKAMAKISMRLVANQDPEKIMDAAESHLRSLTPPGVRLEVIRMQGGKPWLTPRDHPVMQAAGRAMHRGFGAEPVFIREGGSIPLVSLLEELFGAPCVLMGIGLPDENAHAPNENLDLGNFYAGIASAAFFFEELGSLAS
jgi:acetylornithine deacetylase/succinyl-diaminopimelate desuccinylase-like protein